MIVPEDGQIYGGVVLDITPGGASISDCKSGRAGIEIIRINIVHPTQGIHISHIIRASAPRRRQYRFYI